MLHEDTEKLIDIKLEQSEKLLDGKIDRDQFIDFIILMGISYMDENPDEYLQKFIASIKRSDN